MNHSKTPPKVESDLKNNLKTIRTRLGLSQAELAKAAGIARQTIGGIEASLYAPSAAVALKLARVLGCRVEELFWLEEPVQTLKAIQIQSKNPTQNEGRVLLGKVGENWIAHSLSGEEAFRSEMIPADGIITHASETVAEVQLMDSLESLSRSVLIAGCSPALSLWTRSAQQWHPGLKAHWIHANSSRSLEALARGEVHIAGLHLCDPATGEENEPFVRRALPGTKMVLINFGVWDEGLLVAQGNPHQIRGVQDLAKEGVKFLNRELGAGSRLLLDTLLEKEGIPSEAIVGYAQEATSHSAIARGIAAGNADAGMGTAAMAQLFGLDFVPLRRVRFDFAVSAETLEQEPVAQLFQTLTHRSVLLQLQKLGGYNTTRTGEIVARL